MNWNPLRRGGLAVWLIAAIIPVPASAEEQTSRPFADGSSVSGVPAESPVESAHFDKLLWHYGGFIDLGYSLDFNFPANHVFRDRSTTPKVNELNLNMVGGYVRKDATESSRWGTELLVQAGEDSKAFGFAVGLPEVPDSDVWRHFGRANVSYLAPVGNGLTVQAGLFNSFIGYESLYAKDNSNYTRAWIADYSPYLMFGVNAVYSFNDRWTGAFFIINDYFHLENSNSVPSYGGQVQYKPAPTWTFKETVYYGPDQSDTAIEFWRFFSDSIIEWKRDRVTLAIDYQVGTQRNASVAGNPRDFYTGAALETQWRIIGPWAVSVRPELYWDRNGLMTGSEQFIKAITTTGEYRIPYQRTNTICRLEYRYDDSTGPGGGFFKGTNNVLTPGQQMLIFSIVGTLDSP
ncbi:MAG: outer membrane beta-barrel protein [Nitrospira sp.]|nr:outer membrane beta-barrel protein [Nitrospira sp.]